MKTLLLMLCTLVINEVAVAQRYILFPVGGNTFSSKHVDESKTVTTNGIENWTDAKETFTSYIRIAKPGTISLSVNEMGALGGRAVVEFKINGQAKQVTFDANKKTDVIIGSWSVKDTGYVAIHIRGISKAGSHFPSLSKFNISGTAITDDVRFVKNNEGNFFYWGRRGPSVHLNYQVPANIKASWYYNEITVPAKDTVIGSYFMAIGFGEGYFGIQVNSATERRVLFSVWSPFNTDDPASIPETHKIKMLKKGEGVHTGEFGNEGSGGQSYLKYNWKAGNTYKFLLHGMPSGDSTTTYTAWFYAPELNKWQLIACFKRPQTKTYLQRFHSFLENFIPENGDLTRTVLFNNQWVADESGIWTEINTARFTTDNTGNKQYRMDFGGGINGTAFYLKNCGFFNDYTIPKTLFTRPLGNKKPAINLNDLP